MNDAVLVRVGHGIADLCEQRQSRGHIEIVITGVIEQVPALDELHHQIRKPLVRAAAIENARDPWMLQPRENLPLAPETPHQVAALHSALHDLDRHFLLKHFVIAAGTIHDTHSAFALNGEDLVGADPHPW